MKNDKPINDHQISFIFLVGFSSINLLIFVIPALIVYFFLKIIDPTILAVLFLISLLSIPLNALLLLLFAPQGKSFPNFLVNSIISYGSIIGILFGGIIAIGEMTSAEKIIIVIISFIWGTISGIISAIITRKQYNKKDIHRK